MRVEAALIAGGGPAGAIAATLLARGGARPLLAERQAEIGDALCGGFLSWQTLATLKRIGVPRETLAGHRVYRLRLFHDARTSEAKLPAPAMGVSRRTLDRHLLALARDAGAGVELGVSIRHANGRTLHTADGAALTGEALLLATGKHELRGMQRAVAPVPDSTLGLRWRLPSHPALTRMIGDSIELHLFEGGYAGLVLQEDGSANLCMAVRRSRLTDAGSPDALLAAIAGEAPHLADRVACAARLPRADAVANVPYGWRARTTKAGLFRLGDQAAVIPSLAGEGIGIAIASGQRAAEALLRSGPQGAVDYQRRLARDAAQPIGIARLAWHLAERRWGAAAMLRAAQLPGAAGAIARATRIGPDA